MQRSVLEQEVARKVQFLRIGMQTHDRAVLVGFIFSVIPILPISILGFLIGLLNFWLYCAKKLEPQERRMILGGLWLASLNIFLGLAVSYYALTHFGSLDWQAIYQSVQQLFRDFRHNLPLPLPLKERVAI